MYVCVLVVRETGEKAWVAVGERKEGVGGG